MHTIENMEAAEESLAFTDSEEQRQQIEAKNERRRESIDSFRSEIKDEARNKPKLMDSKDLFITDRSLSFAIHISKNSLYFVRQVDYGKIEGKIL